MHEYEDIDNPDEIAQGDVIEWVGRHAEAPWRTFGIVVTADCDLAWKKHGNVVSYVPAMLAEDFIWFAWRPTLLEKHEPALTSEAARRLNTWRAKNLGASTEISSDAVRAWLSRAGVDGLLDELGVGDKGQRNNLRPHLEKLVAIDAARAGMTPDMDCLKRAHEAINVKSAGDPSIIVREIQAFWNALPGDIYHIPSTPSGDEQGLFLMLRHIRQVNAQDITGRPAALREGDAKAKRVARVSAPYRYAITQNLARVFADIGLPAEHDDRKKNAAARFFEMRSQHA